MAMLRRQKERDGLRDLSRNTFRAYGEREAIPRSSFRVPHPPPPLPAAIPSSDPVSHHPARTRGGWNQLGRRAHRRYDDPQPPQFRAFALPRISLREGLRGRSEREGNDDAEGFKRCRDSTRERGRAHAHAHAHVRVRTYIPYTRINVTAFTLNPICPG